MKEELTTAMHSEFTVTPEIDRKHRVFSLLTLVKYSNKKELEEYAKGYDVTMDDVEKYKDEFFRLRDS